MPQKFGIIVYKQTVILQKIQIEAACIVTGLSTYASFHSIYMETLSTRREVNKQSSYFFLFEIKTSANMFY